jgi:hypothetical protein
MSARDDMEGEHEERRRFLKFTDRVGSQAFIASKIATACADNSTLNETLPEWVGGHKTGRKQKCALF